MQRGRQIAASLHRHLPDDYLAAIAILVRSLGPKNPRWDGADADTGLGSFLYLPHVFFIAEHGLEHFDASMHAQYELTQRFTAEWSIRPYLERFPQATLARLRVWAGDESEHVRRLVSEGTRPRLPWASRLREFQKDPKPVLALLELLKDDPALYVRRSVANNLNDIGKDHPELLVATARRWMKGASENRQYVVRHALRSAVKAGDADALAVLGYADQGELSISKVRFAPSPARIGEAVIITFDVTNKSAQRQRVLADLRVHFVKANGKASPKVFKLKALELDPGEAVRFQKKVSMAALSTRKHFPGSHCVEALLNGAAKLLGRFELVK